MSPCSPNDVNIPIPTGPSGPAIPGFGIPFSPITLPNISPFPDGFPEDLLSLLSKIQFLIPSGALKAPLNPNFGKDIFDSIMKLLDLFMPFLMMYKFFLPILNIIICILEVLCALLNPFKLASAISNLFSVCIPEFLSLFPIFALIIMIISLLLLILALIEYIIAQIIKFVLALLRNINALIKAFQNGAASSVLAIAQKLGALLCIFQNLFVLLSIFTLIIQVFKDILSKLFAIPPCDDGNNGNPNQCCTPDVCPAIIKNGNYTRTTGTLQYVNQIGLDASTGFFASMPAAFQSLFASLSSIRTESWQLFDIQQPLQQEFINITHAFDVPADTDPFPVFFPTDASYSATTTPTQAVYTVNLRFFYNPLTWGRGGLPRFVRINNCIILKAPTTNLVEFNNSNGTFPTGVISLAGGVGFEDDGKTVLTGFAANGITPIKDQATLNNFLHVAPINLPPSAPPIYTPAIDLIDLEYTFQPNLPALLGKNLVTLGCMPDVARNRTFVNTVIAGNIGLNTVQLQNLINGTGNTNGAPNVFPDPNAAQECLSTALSALRTNLTTTGVAEFQATATICLSKLQNDTNSALANVIGIGTNPCTSLFTLNTNTQFTSLPITVAVTLNENSGTNVASGLPASVGAAIASEITAFPTLGSVGPFSYDGYGLFTADLTSGAPGNGQIMIAFNDNILCTDNVATTTHSLQSLDYAFVYTNLPATGEPRRNETDVADDKDGS